MGRGGERWGVGDGSLSTTERLGPLPEKMNYSLEIKLHVLVHSERYFVSVSSPEKC